ncbi:hypothetical protein EON65_07750 [archaeon]|nr:MAG: hypothetical protein EON65_07750 [archaeon]
MRLQKKHNATVAATQEKVLYRRILLTNLFNSPDSRSSTFHQSFMQLFSQVPVATAASLPIPSHNPPGSLAAYSSGNLSSATPAASTSSAGKGWLGEWGTTVQQFSTACFSGMQSQSKMIADKAGGGTASNDGGLFGGFFGGNASSAGSTNANPAGNKENSTMSLHTSSSDNFQLVHVRNEAGSTSSSDHSSSKSNNKGSGKVGKSNLGGDAEYEQVDNSSAERGDTASFPIKLPRSLPLYYCACLVSIVRRKPLADGAVRKEIAYDRLVGSMQSATCYVSPYYFCIAISNNLLVGMVNNSIQLINSNMSSLMSSMTHRSKEVYSMDDLDTVCIHRLGTCVKSRNNTVADSTEQEGAVARRPSASGDTSAIGDSSKVGSNASATGGNTVSHRVVSAHGVLKISLFAGLKEVYLTPIMMDASKLEMVIKEVQGAFSSS